MASWAERAAALLAPELAWTSTVVEHADYGLVEDWQASHVVQLAGEVDGRLLGRGESLLAAGGRGRTVGGSGRIRIEALRPFRRLDVDDHCDVTHWDLDVGPVDEPCLTALRASLEEVVGASLVASHEQREPVETRPLLATDASDADVALWLGDLGEVGIRAHTDGAHVEQPGGTSAPSPHGAESDGHRCRLWATASALTEVDEIDAAVVTLGEVLAEAGETEWARRAIDVLRGLPDDETS